MIPGTLLSFSDPVAGAVPSLVPFQYNPAEITRVLTVQRAEGTSGLRVSGPPSESCTMSIELDALGSPGSPITGALGIGPMLQTIEAMLEPGGGGLAGLLGSVSRLVGGGAGAKPVRAPTLPLVLLAWGPARVAPVRIDAYTARETGFDELLNPVQATVEITLTVLRPSDLEQSMILARAMATAYQELRKVAATAGILQGLELSP